MVPVDVLWPPCFILLAKNLQVRSARLDDLSDGESKLLLALGNNMANSIWEAGISLQKGWEKPTVDTPRSTKESFIKSKYQWKGFLEYKSEDGRNQKDRDAKFSVDLFRAAGQGDLYKVAEALAKGGCVEWKNSDDGDKTAMHACVVGGTQSREALAGDGGEIPSSWKGIECAELLIQNGAKLDATDQEEHDVLECAVCGNGRREMVEYLTAKFA